MDELNVQNWGKIDSLVRQVYDQRKHIVSKLESIEHSVDELVSKVS